MPEGGSNAIAIASNTTAVAIATASQPYFSTVISTMLGGEAGIPPDMVMGGGIGGMGGGPPTKGAAVELLRLFMNKLSRILPLPWPLSEAATKAMIGVYCMVWFILFTISLVIWIVRPSLFLKKGT